MRARIRNISTTNNRLCCLVQISLFASIVARSDVSYKRFASAPAPGLHQHYLSPPPSYFSARRLFAFGHPKYFIDKYIPSNKPGVTLKVPNYDVLFDEICKASPLAKQAIYEESPGGIKAINKSSDTYKWKVTDSYNPKRLVSEIEKIDNFQQNGVPLLRLRSSLQGPSKRRGEYFAELITTEELRHQWDATNDIVDEIYSADMNEVKKVQDVKYGEPTMFGIGYVKTKQSVVSPREQMTLCGLQSFDSGAQIIWGIELEESQNHLFPEDQTKRMPRSTSHLFACTIIPTGDDAFDVEYVLQLEIGGFPGWLTGPVVCETVKKMFRFAEDYFQSDELKQKLASLPDAGVNTKEQEEVGGIESTETAEASLLGEIQTLLVNAEEQEEVGDSMESTETAEASLLDEKQTLLMTP